MLRDTVKGLDGVLKTDIPKGMVIIIAGGVGALKSSFVYNVLSNYLAKHPEEFGVYATLEETRESLLRNMTSLGIKRQESLQALYQKMGTELKIREQIREQLRKKLEVVARKPIG